MRARPIIGTRSYAMAACLAVVACEGGPRALEREPTEALVLSLALKTLCDDNQAGSSCNLGTPRFIRLLPDTSVVVVEGQTDVTRLTQNGERSAIGTRGDGPGEFQFVGDVAVASDSTLNVLDVRHFRVTTVHLNNTIQSTTPLPVVMGVTDIKLRADKAAILTVEGGDSIAATVPAKLEVYSIPSGALTKTIQATGYAVHGRGTDLRPIPTPFSPQLLWDMSGDMQLAIAYGAVDNVVLFGGSSGDTRQWQTGWRRLPIGTTSRDSVAEALRNPGGRPSASPAYRERVETVIDSLPKLHPVFDQLRFDDTGNLLVRQGGATKGHRTIIVLRQQAGVPQASFSLPLDVVQFDARGGLVAVYTIDASGHGKLALHSLLPEM